MGLKSVPVRKGNTGSDQKLGKVVTGEMGLTGAVRSHAAVHANPGWKMQHFRIVDQSIKADTGRMGVGPAGIAVRGGTKWTPAIPCRNSARGTLLSTGDLCAI